MSNTDCKKHCYSAKGLVQNVATIKNLGYQTALRSNSKKFLLLLHKAVWYPRFFIVATF